jgi:hypothetical protein
VPGLVTEWVPVEASTETWRARVRDEDNNQAEAVGPRNEVRLIEPTRPPDGPALRGADGDADQPAAGRRQPARGPRGPGRPVLTAPATRRANRRAVQTALGTAGLGDPHHSGTGQAKLDAVQAHAQQLLATAAEAFTNERSGR